MKYLQNLHTHSVYCDGKDTPEEMVQKALSLGFDTLGFSAHAYMYYSLYMSKKGDRTNIYIEEVNRLKKAYVDKIRILLGIELDMYAPIDLSPYEYVIGSMHYFKFGENLITFDLGADYVKNLINEYFDGDGMKMVKKYYEDFAGMHSVVNSRIDVVGHADIILKNNDILGFVDTTLPEYRSCAVDCIRELAKKTDIFELNTGAISRGYRKNPYPETFLIEEINRLGKGIIITSDCHDKNYLDYYFDESLELLKSCGVGEVYVYSDQGFVPRPLY